MTMMMIRFLLLLVLVAATAFAKKQSSSQQQHAALLRQRQLNHALQGTRHVPQGHFAKKYYYAYEQNPHQQRILQDMVERHLGHYNKEKENNNRKLRHHHHSSEQPTEEEIKAKSKKEMKDQAAESAKKKEKEEEELVLSDAEDEDGDDDDDEEDEAADEDEEDDDEEADEDEEDDDEAIDEDEEDDDEEGDEDGDEAADEAADEDEEEDDDDDEEGDEDEEEEAKLAPEELDEDEQYEDTIDTIPARATGTIQDESPIAAILDGTHPNEGYWVAGIFGVALVIMALVAGRKRTKKRKRPQVETLNLHHPRDPEIEMVAHSSTGLSQKVLGGARRNSTPAFGTNSKEEEEPIWSIRHSMTTVTGTEVKEAMDGVRPNKKNSPPASAFKQHQKHKF